MSRIKDPDIEQWEEDLGIKDESPEEPIRIRVRDNDYVDIRGWYTTDNIYNTRTNWTTTNWTTVTNVVYNYTVN